MMLPDFPMHSLFFSRYLHEFNLIFEDSAFIIIEYNYK